MKVVNIIRHSVDFVLLAGIIGLGLGGLVYFRFDVAAQIAVVVLMSFLYICWGAFHHFHDGNLTGKVVLEYTAMAALIAFILIAFLLRA
jgi:hypothetical protein